MRLTFSSAVTFRAGEAALELGDVLCGFQRRGPRRGKMFCVIAWVILSESYLGEFQNWPGDMAQGFAGIFNMETVHYKARMPCFPKNASLWHTTLNILALAWPCASLLERKC